MEWMRAALLCVAGAILCSVLRPQKPEMALTLAAATGIVAVGMCLPVMRETVEILRTMFRQTGAEHLDAMIKATGIGVVSEFAAQLCRDAGESALAGRAEMAGRLALAMLAAPMILQLVQDISELLRVSF